MTLSDALFIVASVVIFAALRLLIRMLSRREPVKYERQHETYTVNFHIGVQAQFAAKDEAGRLAVLSCYLLNTQSRVRPPC